MLCFRVGPIAYPVGGAEFLGSFFDTTAVLLENGSRGSRYATLASLYEVGELPPDHTAAARQELGEVAEALRSFAPSAVVWDIDDRTRRPPWGGDIASTITTLADYHVTSDGRRLITVLDTALEAADRIGKPLRIGSSPPLPRPA
ncbi:hypothetical protein GCM10027408_33060 [Microbacterium tumbae]